MMDEKSAAVGPTPPYEATQQSIPAPVPQHPIYTNDAINPNVPTQYPHQPIPPPGGQPYIHTPAGSPPPQMGHSPPPMGHPAMSPPPQQQQPQQFIHQTSPVTSPGQEKPQFYVQQQVAHPGVAPVVQQGSQYQTAVPLASLQKTPAPVDCPNCRHRCMTRVEFHSGNMTHVWALVLCCLVLAPCVAYIIKGTKDVEHKCGHCGTLLASYHASGHTETNRKEEDVALHENCGNKDQAFEADFLHSLFDGCIGIKGETEAEWIILFKAF